MKTYSNLYPKVYNLSNLIVAWRSARKGKTKRNYVREFEKDLIKNLLKLQEELKNQIYKPLPLKTFILRDPKTRKICKSDFRDRIVHHALIRVIEPIFDKSFIYDSYANRKSKGTLKALERFNIFKMKVSRNGRINGWFNNSIKGYCLKADIKHYFQEVDPGILLEVIQRKIKDKGIIWLVVKISNNFDNNVKGMPLGNLTSQFFANLYLNELDYFIKHKLKAKYYLRYVDDFIILHSSKLQLQLWKQAINSFLKRKLRLELHPQKSRIISLSKGIDFVGFRNFYYYKLLRKRNIRNMNNKIRLFKEDKINFHKLSEIYQGWQAYAKWANSYLLRKKTFQEIKRLTPPSFFNKTTALLSCSSKISYPFNLSTILSAYSLINSMRGIFS